MQETTAKDSVHEWILYEWIKLNFRALFEELDQKCDSCILMENMITDMFTVILSGELFPVCIRYSPPSDEDLSIMFQY